MTLAPQPRSGRSSWTRSPDARALAAVLLVVGVVYGTTLCPTVWWYDSAEFCAHAVALTVAHPPGYPTYLLIAHPFTWLPGEPALGVNLLSVVSGLVSVALLYRLARIVGLRWAAATVAASTLAVLPTPWANAIIAEAYLPGLAFSLGALVLLHRGIERQRLRWILLAALVAGLGVGVHMSIATLGLGYAALALSYRLPVEQPRHLLRLLRPGWRGTLRVGVGSVLAVAVGLCTFVLIPLREFRRWDAQEWAAMVDLTTGGPYKTKLLDEYDLAERASTVQQLLVDDLSWLGLIAAVIGVGVLLRRNPRWGLALSLAAAGNLWWFFNYDVHDLNVFFIPTLAIAALAIAASVDELARLVARRWPLPAASALLGLALPLWLLAQHYDALDMSDATEARAYGEAVCELVPEGSLFIHNGRPEEWRTFAVILYMQRARGRCVSVQVALGPELSWVRAQSKTRSVYSFTRKYLPGFESVPEGPVFRLKAKRRRLLELMDRREPPR